MILSKIPLLANHPTLVSFGKDAQSLRRELNGNAENSPNG